MAAARPQSAPAGGARPRVLRVGVLLGGKIVEERVIRERTAVTIGQSTKNTFSIPVDGLPLELTLFAIEHDKYSLRFLSKMDGRLSDGSGQVQTLEALKAHGAQKVGDLWQVPLSSSSRGKLSIGDLTILFQFVTEPPRQPKPMLPASVRGTLADRIDPRLSVILAASILFHFSIVIVAWLNDPEIGGSIAERAYNLTFKQDTYEVDVVQPQPTTPTTAAAAGSAAAAEKTPTRAPAKSAERGGGKPDSGGRSEGKTVAMQEDEARQFANVLTGEGQAGSSEGDMSNRRPGSDLSQELDAVKESGRVVAIGGGTNRGSRGDGDPKMGTGAAPKIDAPAGPVSAGGGKVSEKGPSGRINVADKQTFDESTLTPDIVLSKIQAVYMAGLKRCYKNYLAKDASARGKVTLSLTVNETGRTTVGKAKGFASEVDDCITGQMSSWRFPVPKDKDGDPTEAAFAITLQLVPD